jgi:hypothetical protein
MALTTPSEILDPCKLRATERVSGMTVRRQSPPKHALLQCGKVWKQGWDLAALVSIARNGREVFENHHEMLDCLGFCDSPSFTCQPPPNPA